MDDTRLINPWVLGGDARYFWAVKKLRQDGLPVKTYGVPGLPNDAPDLKTALSGADLLILPLMPFQDELLIIGEETYHGALLPELAAKGAQIIAGTIPDALVDWYQRRGMQCMTFLDLESYQMENAAVTAEGALELALRRLNQTIRGSKCLVIGWGRIGKFLAPKLRDMGAEVTVSARRSGHWAQLAGLGLRPERTGEYRHGLGGYDVIFNTVPKQIMTEEQLTSIPSECLLVELASEPGGFPEGRGDRVETARGLPGKTAPKSAGEIVAAAVWACLGGEGRSME